MEYVEYMEFIEYIEYIEYIAYIDIFEYIEYMEFIEYIEYIYIEYIGTAVGYWNNHLQYSSEQSLPATQLNSGGFRILLPPCLLSYHLGD